MADIWDYDDELDNDVEALVCGCCASLMASGDDSSCRSYWGHTHAGCTLPPYATLTSDIETHWSATVWECAGCGSDIMYGAQFALATYERSYA